jgi:hypothetical protein
MAEKPTTDDAELSKPSRIWRLTAGLVQAGLLMTFGLWAVTRDSRLEPICIVAVCLLAAVGNIMIWREWSKAFAKVSK